jgi:transposase
MAKHRSYSVEFKRQFVQDYLTGETLHGIAKRHDISRNLIRIWIAKHEAGALDSDTAAASMLTEYEARIAALEARWQAHSRERVFKGGLGARS